MSHNIETGNQRVRYDTELDRLQGELVAMEHWIQRTGAKIVVVLEGRDAAGKGGTIKRIVEPLNPRGYRVVSLPVPSERERSQWYFQRFIEHLPAGGELVLFDRSWYSRALVESVMGFCTTQQTDGFIREVPVFERLLSDAGVTVIKYWLSVSPGEQRKRLQERADDPAKRWKLSPMDGEAVTRYGQYSAARDRMLTSTSTAWAPWYVIDADDKKDARLTVISHLLTTVPYVRLDSGKPPKVPKVTGDTPNRPQCDAGVRVPVYRGRVRAA